MFIQLENKFTPAALCTMCEGRIFNPKEYEISSICTDSREAVQGSLFLCIKGEKTDGHDYVSKAVENGACCILCTRPMETDIPQIIVDDVVAALGQIASAYRKGLKALVCGVTGSVGKTTTKQLLYAIMKQKFNTHLSQGNFNSLIGLPMSVLSIGTENSASVLELGMSAPGEISTMSKIARPDIGVITNIGNSHLEYLKTRENIAKAKLEILDGMHGPYSLVLNGDEPLLEGIKGAKYVSLRDDRAYCFIKNVRFTEKGTFFDMSLDIFEYQNVYVPAIGRHIAFDAAIAATAAHLAGCNEDEIRAGLSSFENVGDRQKIIKSNGITIIDDCYNASPESMQASMAVLYTVAKERKIAVLGDMLELGKDSELLHYEVGQQCGQLGVDTLFAFGKNAVNICRGAQEIGVEHIFYISDITQADILAGLIKNYIKNGDTVLFKASHGIALERVVDLIK